MKRIYKRIEVASAEILLTLALFSDVGGTESVDAADLDRLEAQLSRTNYTGAEQLPVANVQRSHLEITNEGEVLAVLHRLKRGENIFVCKARYGTNISVQLTIDFVVTDPNETTPVEISEDVVLVESIGDGGGGQFPTDYAKQGTNPDATLTDTQAYAQKASSDAAAAKVAAQSLTSLDSDINAGKSAIALAVSNKGVSTSPADTMLQMAANIQQITQSPMIIDGGEMYAKQLFGSLTTPNYWNLYDVLAQLLSDGRLNNYGGILLAEYYKGYDSIVLSGAGAGGAYVVSDVDSNGNFIMYTEDITHTWDTEFDGKGNRWVAYCFSEAGHDFEITDANTSPRSIFIGRNVGTIKSLVSGRCSEIVVLDGNSLGGMSGAYSQSWNKKIIIRNLNNITQYSPYNPTGAESLYISGKSAANGGVLLYSTSYNTVWSLRSAIFKIENPVNIGFLSLNRADIDMQSFQNLAFISICMSGSVYLGSQNINDYTAVTRGGNYLNNLREFEIISEQITVYDRYYDGAFVNTRFILSYINNDKDKSVSFSYGSGSIHAGFSSIKDVELKDGWCKPVNIALCTALTEANMYAHILQRLKQDEADCGDGVTITLGASNLAKLTSQESVDLLDALTNTYGYTFA